MAKKITIKKTAVSGDLVASEYAVLVDGVRIGWVWKSMINGFWNAWTEDRSLSPRVCFTRKAAIQKLVA